MNMEPVKTQRMDFIASVMRTIMADCVTQVRLCIVSLFIVSVDQGLELFMCQPACLIN